jgi:16S rRNA C967 or C1407 C5-methylase (RsmB/RsmF family)
MSEALSPLPPEFCVRLGQIVPVAALPEVLRSFERERAATLRFNTLRTNVDDAVCELRQAGIAVERCAWCDVAGIVPAAQKRQLTEHPAVMDGRVYIQGLSSLLAVTVLAPQPGEAVLDLAAAPGGKTLHMAAMMQKQGRLSAVEPVRARFFKLRDNLRRGGAEDFVRLYQTDGRFVGRKTPEQFDAVLLDAPCTSEARFDCHDPTTWQYWGPRKLAESARKQKALLRSAIDAARIGGRILYCTCSFAPEENELVVAHALRRLGGKVEVLPFELPISNVQAGLVEWNGKSLPAELALARRVLPNDIMDGFFLALLHKTAATRDEIR